MKVLEVMTRSPACCSEQTPLQEVARMMVDNNCGLIPVVDEGGAPIGVVTDRDIVCRTVAIGKNPLDMTVADAMTRECQTIRMDASVDECCDLLERHQIRRAIVVDDKQRVVGIVAQADLARRSEILGGEVVAAVSQPTVGPSAIH